MAQNYLDGAGNHDMELVGSEYFENLVKRSFFQDFERSEYDGSIIRCKMHDIVHDFAQFLTKNECFIMEVDSDVMSYEKVRHLMINGDSIPLSIYNQKNLRTLVIEYSYVKNVENTDLLRLFEQLKCLRTLSLKSCSFSKLPKEIKHLVHLRYLSLSRNYSIAELSEKLCGLYNLQTLDLTNCWNLQKLPEGIGKLVNLRHLLTDGTDSLSYMPRGIDRLTRLRTLNKLIISGDDHGNRKCRSLECLKNLDHRQGSFVLKGLGNVRDVSAVKPADFKNKKNLIHLSLSFDKGKEYRRMDEENEVILEALQPPPSLVKLSINHYEGKTMTFHWMVSLIKLKELELDNCINFKFLPFFGKLPSLESLFIRNMKSVKKVGNEFLGIENGNIGTVFPKLESLKFGYMEEWEEWDITMDEWEDCDVIMGDEDITIMPRLRFLSIGYCHKLKALPDHIFQMHTLEEFAISNCSVQCLNKIWIFSYIRKLNFNCFDCEYLPPLGKLPSLESLTIWDMRSVKKVGNEFLGIENDTTSSSSIVAFPKLTYLQFVFMNEWEEWNYEITRSRDEDVTIMPCLYELSIHQCNKLKALPDHIRQAPTLQHLTIDGCSILEQRYKKETGEYWCQIAHIPNIEID